MPRKAMRTNCFPAARPVVRWCLAAGLLGFVLTGCGDGGGPTVRGTVNLDGRPLADAQVHFLSEGSKTEEAVCKTAADGSFQVQPRSRGGMTVPPGKYLVLITKLVDKKGAVPSDEDFGQLEAAGQLRNAIPRRYNDRDFPQLTAEIKPGTNALPPFELKSK
jgi:hypothetical protein